jgi:hypothetical protein
MSKSALFFFVLVIFITSACQLNPNVGSASEATLPQPTDMPSPSATTAETLSGQLVTDTRVGFTFYYPDGWTFYSPGDVSTATAYAYTMQSSAPSPDGGGGGLPPNTSKVDLYVNPSDAGASFPTIQTRLEQEDQENEILTLHSIEATRLENGMDALLVRGTGMGGDFVSLHILLKGYEVIATVSGDEQYLWDIANSLRETN